MSKKTPEPAMAIEIPSNGPIVVLFSGTSCPPCEALKPHLAAEIMRRPGVAYLVISPSSKTQQVYLRHNVRSSPTVIYFKNGVELGRFSGGRKADELAEILNRWNVR